jgi:hypothetical protein
MSLNSVNTNSGALVALQNLNATNNELATVQSRINTGKKVNSAKDNGAIWAIARASVRKSRLWAPSRTPCPVVRPPWTSAWPPVSRFPTC